MDTSETYIKMCEKLPEDFCPRPWGALDMQVLPSGFYYLRNEVYYIKGQKIIQLYRQDQLQEMIDQLTIYSKVRRIYEFTWDFIWEEEREVLSKYAEQFTSMEQLWLAFVMKERWNKIWNGENWVASKVKAIK